MNVYIFYVYVARANKFGTKRNGAGGARTSLYSIEFSPHHDAGRGLGDDSVEFEDDIGTHVHAPQLSPRPMTPRRVKRRSVISRGSTGRSSLPNCHDKRSSVRYSNNVRSSLRTSGRRSKLQHQNPVTRLIEQQQQSLADSSTSNDSTRLNLFDPSSSSQADLLSNASTPHWKKASGHTNPLYQQSSMQSLDDDDVYNNRPSSARSSYSNYHGTRPISCYVGPGGTPAYYMAGQATAQVPVTNTHRRSNHAIAKTRPTSGFLNSGPPAYQVQGVVDSETVI
ncbi:hypothetical protein L798_10381 [Zootermopsis nevadensis]|uniref:Uncharacterized protein n=1 Tax=Zootermopsis nevadensis TaxID=136037 RepID=A0A067R522_ZOONE|nr:hypothetical protein L798_10381 [Zootermopsis nevadensis]